MWYQNLSEGLVIGVLGSLIATLFVTLLAKTRQIPGQIIAGLLSTRKRSQARLEHALQQYRARLDSATFRIHHSWMKEGQTLEDILVPVFVDAQDGGGVENLPLVLSQAFRDTADNGAPRFMVLGGPGAGKSVSLRLAARLAWSFKSDATGESLIPVLLYLFCLS